MAVESKVDVGSHCFWMVHTEYPLKDEAGFVLVAQGNHWLTGKVVYSCYLPVDENRHLIESSISSSHDPRLPLVCGRQAKGKPGCSPVTVGNVDMHGTVDLYKQLQGLQE